MLYYMFAARIFRALPRNIMIALHAYWDHAAGALCLWGEMSGAAAHALERRAQKGAAVRTLAHPFALGRDKLIDVLLSLRDLSCYEHTRFELQRLRLPSNAGAPLPSPELALEQPVAAGAAARLQSWTVTTMQFEPGSAFDFLMWLPAEAPFGIGFGQSLRFWSDVAKFALELVSRQQFAPGVRESDDPDNEPIEARWSAVLGDADAPRLQCLAQALPPVCRAFLNSVQAGRTDAADIIMDALHRIVDEFVRQRARAAELPAAVGARDQQTLAGQWLRALMAEEAALRGWEGELQPFAAQARAWTGDLCAANGGAPFRTCFRLDPPEGDAAAQAWHVSFHLQANDDRSLLVPAEAVWRERSSMLTFLNRTFGDPQERLLGDLGRAARVFPRIEAALAEACPTGVPLRIAEAYGFLREAAPLLEQSGFGVLLPPWWQRQGARLALRLQLAADAPADTGGDASAGLMGRDSIVAYEWRIALGDHLLTRDEFEHLAQLKLPLVRVRGQWVELNPAEIERAIAFFKTQQASGRISLPQAVRLGLRNETPLEGIAVAGVDATGALREVFAHLSSDVRVTPIDTPPTFNGLLRPYQARGLAWLAFLKRIGLGACLADDMGLGKTIQLIALLLHERAGRQPNAQGAPTLIVCPMSVAGNWHRELERFAPSLKVMVHHGGERLAGAALAETAQEHDVVITTYALLHRDAELAGIAWDTVVLDEAQNIKNPAAKQAQAARTLKARQRIAMTGTPVENRLTDLWSIMEFLNPDYLGPLQHFRSAFAAPIERYHDQERAQQLKRLIQPYVLRRLKTDKNVINDLPDKMEINVFCNLTREQATLYQAVVKDMLEQIEHATGIQRKGMVLATLTKLKQVCNHPAHFLHDRSALPGRSGKLARLTEMLEEVIAEGGKALVFTQFAEMGALLHAHVQATLGCETLYLHGGVPKAQRDALVARFQQEAHGPPVFLLTVKAGGIGLNLTAANHVFHFDRWWNPAVENQATDRAFRIGQDKHVQVYKYLCVGTLEERISDMLARKAELADRIVGAGEAWITELSTQDLQALFTLSAEALAGEQE